MSRSPTAAELRAHGDHAFVRHAPPRIQRMLGQYPLTLTRDRCEGWDWRWRVVLGACVIAGVARGDLLDAIETARKELETFRRDEED